MDRTVPEPAPAVPEDPAKRPWRGCLARTVLLAASAAAALFAAELALLLAGVRVPPRGDAGAQNMLRPVPSDEVPGLHFDLRPGWTGTTLYPDADGPGRAVVYAINAQGFRGPAVPPQKPEGVVRIVALGDSFTYGTGVDAADTWPALLQEELRGRFGDHVEVLNWGVPAYNTRQEIAQLQQRGPAYGPDLVLLCAYVNDASDRDLVVPGERPWEARLVEALGLTSGRWEVLDALSPAQRRMSLLRERSRLADVAAHALHQRLVSRMAFRNYVHDWAEGSPGHAMVKSALATGVVLSRRGGFQLLATTYPDLPSLGKRYAFAEQHAIFARLCADLGIPFHDLASAFEGRDPSALVAHAHDKHPNGAANRVAAAALADFVAPRIPAR